MLSASQNTDAGFSGVSVNDIVKTTTMRCTTSADNRVAISLHSRFDVPRHPPLLVSFDVTADRESALIPKRRVTLWLPSGESRTFDISAPDRIQFVSGNHDSPAAEFGVRGDTGSSECVVCMQCPKDTVFYPCGHYACCDVCSRRVSECPLCRTPVAIALSMTVLTPSVSVAIAQTTPTAPAD
jgi:hypothetical protein